MAVSTVLSRAGRPASVSFEDVVTTALTLADEHGLDAVSFRSLAAALGVSPMAVHRASGGIDALRHALVCRSITAAAQDLSWPREWQAVLRVFAERLLDLLVTHPAILEAHRRSPLDAPGAAESVERALAALAQGGLPASDAVYAYLALHDYVTGHAAMRLGRGDRVVRRRSREDLPRYTAASTELEPPDWDRRFVAGLELFLAGIATQASHDD